MATFKGIIVFKKYYKVEVEAKDWVDAHNQMCDVCVADQEPYEMDFEVYDVEESK